MTHLTRRTLIGGASAGIAMTALAGPQTFVLVKCAVTNFGLLVLCLHKNFRWVKPIVASLGYP